MRVVVDEELSAEAEEKHLSDLEEQERRGLNEEVMEQRMELET